MTQANEPGVLLIHGFTSHRSSLEALIPELEQRGIEWHYPILAGHGTSPKDLEDKRWPDWQEDIEQAYSYLRQTHERVVIVALSMGALLGLEVAAQHPDHVTGLVLISPCLRFKAKMSQFTPIVSRLLKKFPNPSPAKFSHLKYARHDRGYSWFPTDTFRSFWERTHQMRPIIEAVQCPVRIIHSRRDLVADPRGAEEIFRQLQSKKDILWHTKSGHEMLLDVETDAVLEEILNFPPLQAQ